MGEKDSSKLEHIAQVPMFQRLSKRQLQRVARHADEVSVPEGKVIAREGEVGRELLVIISGEATVKRGDRSIAKLDAGDFLGEMSLIDGKPRSASVVADTDMTLLTIHSRAFKPLLDDVEGLKDKLILGLVDRLRTADEGLTD